MYRLENQNGTQLLSDPDDGIGVINNYLKTGVFPKLGGGDKCEEGLGREPDHMEGPAAMFVSGLTKVSRP